MNLKVGQKVYFFMDSPIGGSKVCAKRLIRGNIVSFDSDTVSIHYYMESRGIDTNLEDRINFRDVKEIYLSTEEVISQEEKFEKEGIKVLH